MMPRYFIVPKKTRNWKGKTFVLKAIVMKIQNYAEMILSKIEFINWLKIGKSVCFRRKEVITARMH